MDLDSRRFEHGGRMWNYPGYLDFSANINPLGMPYAAKRALIEHVDDFAWYPDPYAQELTHALSLTEGVDVSNIVVTAGATDLLSRICQVLDPRRALVVDPCFSGYAEALHKTGTELCHFSLAEESNFQLNHLICSKITPNIDVIFLANPNNPTSRTIAPAVIEDVLACARQAHALVVLDECFIDFTQAVSAVRFLGNHPELIVVKALTKSYALAGLRVGYGVVADKDLACRLRAQGDTWAVSTPAQVAGVAALQEEGFLARTRAYVARERHVMVAGLSTCGLKVVEPEANYVLFWSARELYQPLFERKIIVRRCDTYAGLPSAGGFWYRAAIRTQKENQVFLAALKEICA
ncbi:MAG: pyridoxal phosphate-dependent aminotransferase [Atopobiaceae bacterium]|jgi:threonine-phosphate decarboxylase